MSSSVQVEQQSLAQRIKSELPTLIRYFGIGVSAALIDLGLFVLCFEFFDWTEVSAQTLSVSVAVLFSFAMNARYNFGVDDRMLIRFASFCVVAFVGYLVGLGVILALRDLFGLASSFGKVLSLPVVFVVQYFLNSRISFRSDPQPASAARG